MKLKCLACLLLIMSLSIFVACEEHVNSQISEQSEEETETMLDGGEYPIYVKAEVIEIVADNVLIIKCLDGGASIPPNDHDHFKGEILKVTFRLQEFDGHGFNGHETGIRQAIQDHVEVGTVIEVIRFHPGNPVNRDVEPPEINAIGIKIYDGRKVVFEYPSNSGGD